MKSSESGRGLGIAKLTNKEAKLYFHEKFIDLEKINELYGYNFNTQKVINKLIL